MVELEEPNDGLGRITIREHPFTGTVAQGLAEFLVANQSGELLLELLRVAVEEPGLAVLDFLVRSNVRGQSRLGPRSNRTLVPLDRRLRTIERRIHERAEVDVGVHAGPLDLVGGVVAPAVVFQLLGSDELLHPGEESAPNNELRLGILLENIRESIVDRHPIL